MTTLVQLCLINPQQSPAEQTSGNIAGQLRWFTVASFHIIHVFYTRHKKFPHMFSSQVHMASGMVLEWDREEAWSLEYLVSKILLVLINKGMTILIVGGLDGHTSIWNLRQFSIYQYTPVAIIGRAWPSRKAIQPTFCPVICTALTPFTFISKSPNKCILCGNGRTLSGKLWLLRSLWVF